MVTTGMKFEILVMVTFSAISMLNCDYKSLANFPFAIAQAICHEPGQWHAETVSSQWH